MKAKQGDEIKEQLDPFLSNMRVVDSEEVEYAEEDAQMAVLF